VVGSIAHADPAAEIPAILIVLGGMVRIRSVRARRTVRADEFLTGPFQPALDDDEWVDEVRFPAPAIRRGFAFEEFARRSGDYALCGVASVAERTDDGRLHVALAFLGMGPVPVRLELPPMMPEELADGVLIEALEDVTRALEPLDDLHASRAYRMWLARRLGARTAQRAAGSFTSG
jgi:carbon-monoxide dehydrogenase medium subunit